VGKREVNRVAKSKWPQVKDKLILIEKWARDGLTEEQISTNLGVSKTTLNEYKNNHPEFLVALKKGKEVFITEVENALAKRALGFEYEETKTYIKFEKGKEIKYQERTKKYYPPDVAACSILLKNKDRGNWSDNPMKVEIEREFMEFKKEMERLKNF
jgi:transcriptional regulator with XRE-family HTH domain